jgi:hypothetical protein
MSPTWSRIFILLFAMIGFVSGPAHAWRNAGGAMIVHTMPVSYRTINDYCNDVLFPPPATCEDAVTNSNMDDYSAVMWVLAAFPEGSSPALTAFQFGIYHNLPDEAFIYQSPCALLEIPDPYWPESGTGTACALGRVVYPAGLLKMYWFAVDGFDGAYIGTGPYPSGPGVAQFCDDGQPPQLDDCYLFGTMRWHAEGENQCPTGEHMGACCFEDGTCTFVTPADCTRLGGSYQGDSVLCGPDPCPGICSCCFEDGHCEMLIDGDCLAQDGTPHPGMTCATYNCPYNPPPTACCFDDGHCEMLTPPDCTARGGISHWNWTCDPNVCPNPPQNGACCVGAQCHWLTHDQCTAQEGQWLGPTIICDPNPCLPATEACCFSDGHCDDLTADRCRNAGGSPQGSGTDCTTVHCEVTPTRPATWGRIKALYH